MRTNSSDALGQQSNRIGDNGVRPKGKPKNVFTHKGARSEVDIDNLEGEELGEGRAITDQRLYINLPEKNGIIICARICHSENGAPFV